MPLPFDGARTLVMGVVNVTPDSFTDGGDHDTVDAAVRHGLLLVEQGADLVDVGGESTRPGAGRVDEDEELRRVVPVVRALAAEGVVVSVDTVRASVARAAVEAGAAVVNDVSGGTGDPAMLAAVAALDVPYVVMHGRGPSADMQSRAVYDDVVHDVRAELAARVEAARAAGVRQVVADPGLGFAKTAEHNLALLAHLSSLSLGLPFLVGASRKAFLGALLGGRDPRGARRRDGRRDGARRAGRRVGGARARRPPLRRRRPGRGRGRGGRVRDRIALRGLRVRGFHGVLAAEREQGQDFLVDAVLSVDVREAAASDDLEDTVDYGALALALAEVVAGEPVDLIETLAERLAGVCLTDPRVFTAEVTVHKPSAPIPLAFQDVSVTVVRP